MSKQFLQKPRYEYYKGTTEVIDNELDNFVEDIVLTLNVKDSNIKELVRINNNQYEQIIDLQHKLKVSDKAVELACSHIPCKYCPNSNGAGICYIAQDIGYYQPKQKCNVDNSYYFKLKAEKEIKGE